MKIGDVVWSHERSWVRSSNGFWSGYYYGHDDKHIDDGWVFVSLAELEATYDFRWIVRDGKLVFTDDVFEKRYEYADELLDAEQYREAAELFAALANDVMDAGL